MGFEETRYADAKSKMEVVVEDGKNMLRSKETGDKYRCGTLDVGEFWAPSGAKAVPFFSFSLFFLLKKNPPSLGSIPARTCAGAAA
jgi:hypothetical protein